MILSNKDYILVRPKTRSSIAAEFESCIAQLSDILDSYCLSADSVVKQSIFLRAENNHEYVRRRDSLMSPLTEFYGDLLPTTSFIGQPPEDRQECAIELILLKEKSAGLRVNRKKLDGVSYTVIEYPDTKEVYAAGLTAAFDEYSTLLCSRNAFDLMKRILAAEDLTFADVVRQWNYIQGILDKQPTDDGIQQNYQIFNDVRAVYYSEADFDRGYPAATGIGMRTGGIILEFIAVKSAEDVTVVPIKNPRQIDAHRYSDEVLVGKPIDGISQKAAPKFERAKYATIGNMGQVYVSGTAAILGQKTASAREAREQTITTIENIQELISMSNLSNHSICLNSRPLRLSYLRVYVKEEKDIDVVKDVCRQYYPDVPALYLISDICRDDLLVELEGIADRQCDSDSGA